MTKQISHASRALAIGVVAALLLAGSAAALTDDRFRVGPSVKLRPVTDVIDTNQDAIVELYMENSNLNDVALNVDTRISVPDGIHVSGEGFYQVGGTGIVAGTFKVLPGDEKSINIIFKADKSAKFGSHTIQITGLYWPGDNKDNFQPLSLAYSVTVKEASNNPKIVTAITQIASPAPAPTAAPESSNSYIYYAGIVGLVLILIAIVALKRRSSSKAEESLKREPAVKPEPKKPAPLAESPKIKPAPMTVPEAPGVYVKTAFGYKGAAIIYKLKIENNTFDPISDIKVYPYIPDVFLLKEKEKSIALIEPKSSQTVTFEIRPTGECGDCNVSGRVNYYDMASRKRQDIELEQKSLSIVCPMLHGKEISEAEWHDTVSNLVKTEESTREIDMPAESLFTMVSRIIKDMHMYMQKPEVTQNHKLFNGVARFYGEGVKGLKYAAQVEVVGGAKKSKLILKVWAEKEDALTGFYHGMLDEIEKRVNVKEYIDDSIVQYNVHIGDRIGTQVKDSVVQRSNIGASARKCPNCGREVEANEKYCLECGTKL